MAANQRLDQAGRSGKYDTDDYLKRVFADHSGSSPRMLVKNPADLKRAVVGSLRLLQKNPAHVRTFFQSPDTRYAA
jgi:hypothetical protein